MNTSSNRIVKGILIAAVVMTLLAAAVSASLQIAYAEGKDENDDRKEVTVEVVGEEPAQDIEESDVPLAASPDSAAAESSRSMIMAWVIAAAVLSYFVFILLGMKRRKINRKFRAGTEGDRGDTFEGGIR